VAILVGTSGFSYDDWRGPFYPPDLPAAAMLPFYAARFDALELNYTYYAMPSARTLDAMAAKAGDRLVFTVKAHREITHDRSAGPETVGRFCQALGPLRERGRLGCVLLQFPWSFPRDRAAQEYLSRLRDLFGDVPLVAEFRHRRWIDDRAFAFLRERGIGYCAVDQPALPNLVPPVAAATSPVGYVRFHGRNAAHWWEHREAWQRYDYRYTREELAAWVPRILALAGETETVYVFTNNHYQAKAVENAGMLRDLLRQGEEQG
jgi:uncharacterized protein YecE (DUF72 family)